jgi:hypothetical protein
MNRYKNFKVCKFCQFFHFILKIYHIFESYKKMLTTLGSFLLYHKLKLCFRCHAHYTQFTCGKGILKIWKHEKYFEFLKIWNSTSFKLCVFLNLGSKLLSSKLFYHQNYVITTILYLILCKINHIWRITYSSSNVFLKNRNPKFNLMKF